MPAFGPVKRRDLIRALRTLGVRRSLLRWQSPVHGEK